MLNIFSLVGGFGLQHVDVTINGHCRDQYVVDESSGLCNNAAVVGGLSCVLDVEEDLLPQFCPRMDKHLLSVNWINTIKEVGQKFKRCISEFCLALCKFFIEDGFNFKCIRNDKSKIMVECASKLELGCWLFVHGALQHANDYFYIVHFCQNLQLWCCCTI